MDPPDQEDLESLCAQSNFIICASFSALQRKKDWQHRKRKLRKCYSSAVEVQKANEEARSSGEKRAIKAARLRLKCPEAKASRCLPSLAQEQLKRGASMYAFGRWHLLCDGLPDLRALQEKVEGIV